MVVVRTVGSNEAHVPIGKLTRRYGPFVEDDAGEMTRVALDSLKHVADGAFLAFKQLKKAALARNKQPGQAGGAVVGARNRHNVINQRGFDRDA